MHRRWGMDLKKIHSLKIGSLTNFFLIVVILTRRPRSDGPGLLCVPTILVQLHWVGPAAHYASFEMPWIYVRKPPDTISNTLSFPFLQRPSIVEIYGNDNKTWLQDLYLKVPSKVPHKPCRRSCCYRVNERLEWLWPLVGSDTERAQNTPGCVRLDYWCMLRTVPYSTVLYYVLYYSTTVYGTKFGVSVRQ